MKKEFHVNYWYIVAAILFGRFGTIQAAHGTRRRADRAAVTPEAKAVQCSFLLRSRRLSRFSVCR
jgi:hypothetical protein